MYFVIKFLYEICILICLTFGPFSPKPDRVRFVIFPTNLDQDFFGLDRLTRNLLKPTQTAKTDPFNDSIHRCLHATLPLDPFSVQIRSMSKTRMIWSKLTSEPIIPSTTFILSSFTCIP